MRATTYRELEIWQEAMDLCEEIYRLTEKYPKYELYALVSQMRRASVSVPSNIAEGFVRKYGKEFKYHLSVSLASLAELDTQLILSKRMQYISEEELLKILAQTERLGKRTTRFFQKLRT